MQKTQTPYNESTWISTTPELRPAANDNWQARRELAAALRDMNCAVLGADVPTEMLRSMTTVVREQIAHVAGQPKRAGVKAQTEHLAAQLGHPTDLFYEMTPAMGQSNAIAPPMHIWHADGCVHARVIPGWSYEGPSNCLHGGVIALLFDQLVGVATLATGKSGRTGTLSIRYHHPTPLNKTLRLKAHIDRVEGRKIFVMGELWNDDIRTASCEGILIQAKPGA